MAKHFVGTLKDIVKLFQKSPNIFSRIVLKNSKTRLNFVVFFQWCLKILAVCVFHLSKITKVSMYNLPGGCILWNIRGGRTVIMKEHLTTCDTTYRARSIPQAHQSLMFVYIFIRNKIKNLCVCDS